MDSKEALKISTGLGIDVTMTPDQTEISWEEVRTNNPYLYLFYISSLYLFAYNI